ncbi:MAG: HPr family phosphocarrier protein [Azospirillaceae bacterium]|nr:HPr family phosphocarrier protein [Azospirillaceae bacterium]
MSNPVFGDAVIRDPVGLHARPAIKMTKLAKRFDAAVSIAAGSEGPWVNAASLVKVMGLKVRAGAALYFRGEGTDAEAAVAAMVDLVTRDFPDQPA